MRIQNLRLRRCLQKQSMDPLGTSVTGSLFTADSGVRLQVLLPWLLHLPQALLLPPLPLQVTIQAHARIPKMKQRTLG